MQQGLELGQQWGNASILTSLSAVLALVKQAQGELDGALEVIRHNATTGVRPGYLAALINTSSYGATRTAASLVRRGLIVRHRDRDGRVVYYPTASGTGRQHRPVPAGVSTLLEEVDCTMPAGTVNTPAGRRRQ